MTDSRLFQQQFQQAVVEHTDFTLIKKPPQGSQQSRLAVYQKAYYLRLLDVMEMDYEVCRNYLGAEQFKKECCDYIALNPSSEYTLENYGKNFTNYFKNKGMDALADLAAFERVLVDMLTVMVKPYLTYEDLSSIEASRWPALSFLLQPHAVVHVFSNDVATCIDTNGKQYPSNSVTVICWQKNFKAYYLCLDEDEKSIIAALKKEMTFEEVCSEVEHREDAAIYVASFVQTLIRNQLLVKFN